MIAPGAIAPPWIARLQAEGASGWELGNALSHDGVNDFCNADTSVDLTTTFTIYARFKLTGVQINDSLLSSQDYFTVGSNGNFIIRIQNGTHISFFSYNGTDDEEGFNFVVPALATDVWYTLVVTSDGIEANLYLDGTVSTSGAKAHIKALTDPSVNGIFIGDANGNNPFGGTIGDLYMWSTSATVANAVSLQNAGTPLDPESVIPGAIAAYRFNEEGDAVITVDSIAGNDADLNNFTGDYFVTDDT